MARLLEFMKEAVERKASDLFIVAGCPVSVKQNGRIRPIGGEKLLPPQTSALLEELYELAGRPMDVYLEQGRDAYSFAVPGLARFRVSAYRQRGSRAAVVRVVAFEIPDWREMRIPEAVMRLADQKDGLVLLTGAAGSGKSTTLACMVDRINRTRSCHVVTVEDPIEFLFRDQNSIISQLEVGMDTPDCLTALNDCLQQAPDVILVGGVQGCPLIASVLTAAETGHLVLTTMRTRGAANAMERMADSFPPEKREQACLQMSAAVRAVVSQQILPGKTGGLFPAFEVLHVNADVRNAIRGGAFQEIGALAAKDGQSVAMDRSILSLYREGSITLETALSYAENPEQMRRRCG